MTARDLLAASESAYQNGRPELAKALDDLAHEIMAACPRCGSVQYVTAAEPARIACAFCGRTAVEL